MHREIMCQCQELPELVEITNTHSKFKAGLLELEVGNWQLLMSCPECGQLWKVDEWDKYRTCYAAKLSTQENWQSSEHDKLVKERIINNRGGLSNSQCMWAGCSSQAVNGVVYCIEHLWETGARE